jgi:hypothetical protein
LQILGHRVEKRRPSQDQKTLKISAAQVGEEENGCTRCIRFFIDRSIDKKGRRSPSGPSIEETPRRETISN